MIKFSIISLAAILCFGFINFNYDGEASFYAELQLCCNNGFCNGQAASKTPVSIMTISKTELTNRTCGECADLISDGLLYDYGGPNPTTIGGNVYYWGGSNFQLPSALFTGTSGPNSETYVYISYYINGNLNGMPSGDIQTFGNGAIFTIQVNKYQDNNRHIFTKWSDGSTSRSRVFTASQGFSLPTPEYRFIGNPQ